MKILVLITARKGSQRIKDKNIKDFCGKPLIFWTINEAKKINFEKDIYVTSNCLKVKNIAADNKVNFIKRPERISGNIIMPDSALLHAYKKINKKYNYIIFLQPTSPLREKSDIENALQTIIKEKADSLLSANIDHSFLWKKKKNFFLPINYDYLKRPRSQDIDFYRENGSIYIFKPNILLKNKVRLGGKISIYKMSSWKNIDIDTPEQFRTAENIFKKKIKS